MTDFWGTFPNQRERIDSAFKKLAKKEMPSEKYILKMFLSAFYLTLHVHY